ncbi:MAG: DUF1573 domain-containing protein [Bacteroidales bacterium]
MTVKNKKAERIYWGLIVLSFGIIIYSVIKLSTPVNRIITTTTEETKNDPLTILSFETMKFDFGKCSQDAVITHDFIFRNTGEFPLIIYSVTPSCLCTSYALSKKVIMPQDTAKINIVFNAKNKVGNQIINTIVRANTKQASYRLYVSGTVSSSNE